MHNQKARGYVRCYVTSILGWSVKVGSSLISIKLGNDPQSFKMKLDFYNTITEGNYYVE